MGIAWRCVQFLGQGLQMTVFRLTNNNHFIGSGHGKTLTVFDMSNDGNRVGVVGPGEAYSGLEVFGVVIRGKTLEQLATEMANSTCLANREGYCILINVIKRWLGVPAAFGRDFLKLNDLFSWSKYGVIPTTNTTVWNRQDLCNSALILVDYKELQDKLSRCERSLQQKEDKLRECKPKLNNLEKYLKDKDKILEDKKKETEHVKAELEAKKKELSTCKNRLAKEEKLLAEKNEQLGECETTLVAKKKEHLTWKKISDEKDELLDAKNKELEDCKLRILEAKEKKKKKKKKNKEKSSDYKDKVASTAELEKELCECKKILEEKEMELTKLGGQLLAKQGAIDALMKALNNFKKP